MSDPKICQRCGTPFTRAANYSKGQWERRRFCSTECGNIGRRQWNTNETVDIEALSIPEPMSGCWLWLGTIGPRHGYGQISSNGVRLAAHRVSYEIHKGPIPKGLQIRHNCDTRSCVNPDHLEIGTAADNNADTKRRNRGAYGERSPHAKLTEEAVREIRASSEPHTELAKKFGASRVAVRNAKIGRTWRRV